MIEKAYSKVNLWIRSFLFSIFSIITIAFIGIFVSVFCWMFPVKTRNTVIRTYLIFYFKVLKFICHMDFKIYGAENIPQGQHVGIILSKHQSTWETFMLPIIFKNPAIIIKRELLWVPFFGWGLGMMGPIAINRSDKATAMKQLIDKGAKCLDEGRSILIFPEGTRTRYGTVGNYRLGGPRLAVATHHPIIPVAHDAGRLWPRRRFIKYPGTVSLVIGPWITTEGKTPEEVLAETKQWIEDTMDKIKNHQLDGQV